MLTSPGNLKLIFVVLIRLAISIYLMVFHFNRTAAAVFYSQTAYTMTIAGVIWGVLIWNEKLSPPAWVALAMIVIVIVIVM